MRITDWPLSERPREKLLRLGAHALSDAELLAIFLRTGTKGKTAVDLARELLLDFGSLRELLAADSERIRKSKGLGNAKYAQLQAILEISRRHLNETMLRGNSLTSPMDTRDYLAAELGSYPFEIFGCLFLDNQHRVIKFEKLFQGTIDSTSVYPREVLRSAIRLNSAAVIFAHNHPSGVNAPSNADKSVTRKLVEALSLIDVRVLDHFIIGDGEAYSFAENGLL